MRAGRGGEKEMGRGRIEEREKETPVPDWESKKVATLVRVTLDKISSS